MTVHRQFNLRWRQSGLPQSIVPPADDVLDILDALRRLEEHGLASDIEIRIRPDVPSGVWQTVRDQEVAIMLTPPSDAPPEYVSFDQLWGNLMDTGPLAFILDPEIIADDNARAAVYGMVRDHEADYVVRLVNGVVCDEHGVPLAGLYRWPDGHTQLEYIGNADPDMPGPKLTTPLGWQATGHFENVRIVDESGAARIASERASHPSRGYDSEHDRWHVRGQLVLAAWSYLAEVAPFGGAYHRDGEPPDSWPWEPESWKPSDDPVRNLEKAGSFIAAEIDRRLAEDQRSEQRERGNAWPGPF